MKETSAGAGGLGSGISSVLAVVFVVLKLCKLINWPWIWVLAPVWISAGIALILIAIVAILILRH